MSVKGSLSPGARGLSPLTLGKAELQKYAVHLRSQSMGLCYLRRGLRGALAVREIRRPAPFCDDFPPPFFLTLPPW